MPRIWIFLCLFMGMTCSGQAVAQSGCNTNRIRTQLETSERFPDLRGCRPDNVRQLLQNHDYGLEIENRVESRTYREGRIVSQRVDDGYVFVDVSDGPGPQRNREIIAGIVEGVVGIISTPPPPGQRPSASEPSPERPPPPAPDQRLIDVMTIPAAPPPAVETPPPARPAPPVLPPVTERIPSPEPTPAPVESAPAAEERVTRPPERPPEPAPTPPTADPAPPPAPVTDDLSLQPEPGDPPPPIQGSRGPAISAVDPPPASRPTDREGTSASNGSETGRVEPTPWWEKLLDALASIPVWAVALAGATAAAGLGIYLFPRATCSIEGGRLGWGARRPRSGWPEAHAEIVMGEPLFSVPSPLSIRRREDVQPSPA